MSKYVAILFLVTLFCCQPEEEKLTSDSISLIFKNDTNAVVDSILFDTILAGQASVFPLPSVTRRLKVINSSTNAIKTSIRLANDGNSPYFLIINGIKRNNITDFTMLGGDSIYIFTQVTPTNQNKNTPFLIQDSILFSTNGKPQRVVLTTWGRDAIYYKGDSITTNTTWENDKVHFLYKSIIVSQSATLTIKKGTEIYASKGTSLTIKGTLKIEGDSGKANIVRFQGPRTENYWENIPSQWKGIIFSNSSQNNNLKFVEIKNGETGISINEQENVSTSSFGEISHISIKNMSKSGISASNTSIKMYNSLIANCANQVLKITNGGNYEFYNNTFANYNGTFSRDAPAVSIADNDKQLNLTIKNNIFWGDQKEELSLLKTNPANWTITQQTNAIKTTFAGFNLDGNIINDAMDFPKFTDEKALNFKLVSENQNINQISPLVAKGTTIPFITNDLEGKPRVGLFDLGAYQTIK